jgi:hypothetical protein
VAFRDPGGARRGRNIPTFPSEKDTENPGNEDRYEEEKTGQTGESHTHPPRVKERFLHGYTSPGMFSSL